MYKRKGSPKRSSRFICLRCLKENYVGSGISRPNTKEKDHKKDLCCMCTNFEVKTKNLEVRWKDNFDERMEYAKKIRSEYYDENDELLPKWKEESEK